MIYKTGQKWISGSEPELGMGSVTSFDERLITIDFELSEETRTYARQQAPLTRVRFSIGDRIRTRENHEVEVKSVSEKNHLLIYEGDCQGITISVAETELHPDVRFSKPQDRLLSHQLDENRWFDLRYFSLLNKARLSESAARGLYGPRVSLIGHQLFIASQVATRFVPRVLLADEVGLGKTIEAGLIIHKQLQTGKASRILIIVPPALCFQWFVELVRRFNLAFVILDEDRCTQIENDNQVLDDPDQITEVFNPFDAQQLMLCEMGLFLNNPLRLEQALESDIDLLVIDEAHHLEWTAEAPGIAYQAAELLSTHIPGLLLLTATPEQLGKEGHYARLRLLDPARFPSLGAFIEEEKSYEPVAQAANKLVAGDYTRLSDIESLLGVKHGVYNADQLLDMLLDRHGTGRILFRNVRSAISGFPDRKVNPYPLVTPSEYTQSANPFFPETAFQKKTSSDWTLFDPRASWLIELIRSLSGAKVLLICANRLTAITLEDYIKRNTAIRTTLFHEEMDLVARDRSATYFAETEKGAQLMICSEIGSEGRNFQFSHHLVLFDLPLSPDLIEQRIGRLDRIGQTSEVNIHVPYFKDTLQESIFRLFHEGLNMFAAPNAVAQTVFEELLDQFDEAPIEQLISQAKTLNKLRSEAVNKGRDRLLELHSNSPQEAIRICEEIGRMDKDPALHDYLEKNFESSGLESEYLGNSIYHLKPTSAMTRHAPVSIETQGSYRYPEIPEEGLMYTFDRNVALSREDVLFLTWEAPLVEQALDTVISDHTGNSTLSVIKKPGIKPGLLLVETLHVIEAVAPSRWNLPHYLPPLVIRSLINAAGENLAEKIPYQSFSELMQDYPKETLRRIVDSQAGVIKQLLVYSDDCAKTRLTDIRAKAMLRMSTDMDGEITRLKQLKAVNPSIREEEITLLLHSQSVLKQAIESASVRLDAVRVLIFS